MHTSLDKKAADSIELTDGVVGRRRLIATGASLAVAMLASACGGGGTGGDGRPPRSSYIGVTIGSQPSSFIPISPGGSLAFAIRAGQSLTLDAGEPVVWNMFIGSTQVTYGAQVIYGGVTIDTFNLNQYVVSLNTYAPFVLQNLVTITLVATSTYDSVQVAAVYLTIGN